MRVWILGRSGDWHGVFSGPHRLGAALQQKDFSIAVDGPFNILRAPVMALDLAADVS
jgi:hypothetical protein